MFKEKVCPLLSREGVLARYYFNRFSELIRKCQETVYTLFGSRQSYHKAQTQGMKRNHGGSDRLQHFKGLMRWFPR